MATRLVEVPEVEEVSPSTLPAQSTAVERALSTMLMVTLKTVSQKTLQAFAALADLLLIGSAFALWYRAMIDPSILQLVGLGGYSTFILIALWARRRP